MTVSIASPDFASLYYPIDETDTRYRDTLSHAVHTVAGFTIAAQAEVAYGPACSRAELAHRLAQTEGALRAARAKLAEPARSPAAEARADLGDAYSVHLSHVVWAATSALVAAQCEIGAGEAGSVGELERRFTEAAAGIALAQSRLAEIKTTGRVQSYADLQRERCERAKAKRAATLAAKKAADVVPLPARNVSA